MAAGTQRVRIGEEKLWGYTLLVAADRIKDFTPGQQIREYKIIERTGHSDIETVYKTEHIFLDEMRSFKVIRTEMTNDPQYRDRFIRQARLFSKLRHKNLARLYEFGTLDEDTFFAVFEYVQGHSVGEQIRSEGKIPYWEAIQIVREAGEGLQVAHKQNLAHNNISLNCLILVTTAEGTRTTKLVDFSLAKQRIDGTEVKSGEVQSEEGIPVEEEQARRSDIYALGVSLYGMIAGASPQTEPPFEDVDGIPPVLNLLLRKACSNDPWERYSSLQEFLHDLGRVPPPDDAKSWSGDTLSLDTPDEFPPGFQLAQRYVIEKLIGKGGMGSVYKARDRVLNVPVALKSINKTITNSERMVNRLKREVILARKVAHPNVCRIYDIGEANGRHYVTMEYLEGQTLGDLLSAKGAFTAETGVPILKQLFLGLQEAHRVGVVHRDLKPQNIMVDIHNRAFVMDFGISISQDARKLTESGIVIGTPWYMAPEQFSSSNVDSRSDIYSMGIIMYQMFTGRLPYDARTPATVMEAHVEAKMFSPSSFIDIHPSFEKVIHKAMAREAVDRYQNVAELLVDLEAAEDTPYAATVIVPRPELPKSSIVEQVAAAPDPDAEAEKPLHRLLRFFKND